MSEPVAVHGAALAALAERLGLPLDSEAELHLERREGRLVLAGDAKRYGHPLAVEFASGKAAHRRRFGGGRGQLIARACGFAQGVTPSVVDATAGLGRDAFVLASLKTPVLMVERVAAIFALLEDGLARALGDAETAEVAARMHLAHGDAATELAALVAAADFPPQGSTWTRCFLTVTSRPWSRRRCGSSAPWPATTPTRPACWKRPWTWPPIGWWSSAPARRRPSRDRPPAM